jgi:hypothetical protein
MQETFDIFMAMGELRRALDEGGEKEWSRVLSEALAVSTAPGEILGETRLQLRRLRASPVAAQLGLLRQIDEAIRHINTTLGGWWRA